MTALTESQPLLEWLTEPQTKAGLRRCAVNALAVINADLSLRVPKTEQERQNAFAFWLEGYRIKIGLEGQKQFAIEFPGVSKNMSEDTIGNIVDELVWPAVESFLRIYAIRYQAGLWGRRRLGDTTIYGEPLRDGDTWVVPLSVARYGNNLGRIVLDADGNVIEDVSSTQAQLLEKICDCQLSTASSILPRVENPRLSGVPPSVLSDANASNLSASRP